MAYYLIEVKGEIFSTGGMQYAQSWACLTRSHYNPDDEKNRYLYDKDTHTVKSNLILTENLRAVPYATYFTEKGIAEPEENSGKLLCSSGFWPAVGYYKDNISKISSLLECDIPKEIEQTFYHGLFRGCLKMLVNRSEFTERYDYGSDHQHLVG